MSFHSRPKHVLKKWKIYATHKDELSDYEIGDFNKLMNALKQAPKPLLKFIHSFFYEHAEVVPNKKVSLHVYHTYTTKLMKYDDYCEMMGITRKELSMYLRDTCLLMYEHYFEETEEEYSRL